MMKSKLAHAMLSAIVLPKATAAATGNSVRRPQHVTGLDLIIGGQKGQRPIGTERQFDLVLAGIKRA